MYSGWETTGDKNPPKEFPDNFDDPDMTPCELKERATDLEIWSDEIKQISIILIRYRYIFKEYGNTEGLKEKILLAEKLKNDFDNFIEQMSKFHSETIEQKETWRDIRTRLTMVKNDYDEFLNRRRKRNGAYKINSNERRPKRRPKRRRIEFQLLNKIKF